MANTLIDTGAEASLIYETPTKFKGTPITISGLGGHEIPAKQIKVIMSIGDLPCREYSEVVVPTPEYIIGIDILRGMSLKLQDGTYHFAIRALQMHSVIVGKLLIDPIHFLEPTKIITSKQYRIPGGHNEITQTIKDYVNAGVMIPTTSAWNNPIWPVRKSDGSWRMTV